MLFEKSLYDLIRGLRNHKGNERDYIQNCLKECRAEIRGADMDLKATSLLKLIYLEMMGHDMSWASFHVLEVMSSAKFHQKRVGYLGAVQSFRPDTEVLMLATNLLKKDLSGTAIPLISLPIITLPHIITPSLALSVQNDLLPRMSHSRANIRKKSIVTLYRLALVYPETLLAAWPKIKERLMDKNEDPSVTAAIVNVVCELGWRRPHDFLPLAPRFFELLVDGKNNWMAIKLIKLFATLTPLEPRLVRKLLPPLTEIIRTTPAMSLLYECINGIIQGGILGSADDISGREEIASLCVDKLRSMIMVDGDANLTYIALLAFNKIVVTHPFLVSQQEDVILECIDSPDITIRIKALDLVQGMVSQDNLKSIVGRLMKQLKVASQKYEEGPNVVSQEYENSDDEPVRERAEVKKEPTLPEDYQVDVIGRILRMCSQNNYSSIEDFDWYIDVLTQLVRVAPAPRHIEMGDSAGLKTISSDITEKIGDELRNVAVKVRAMRGSAVSAANSIAAQAITDTPMGFSISTGALKSVAWILGEYATSLGSSETALNLILQIIPRTTVPAILMTCIQAATKIFSLISGDSTRPWTAERKSQISLLMARIIHTFEPLVLHPSLEVQERAVEFVELLKLTAEAVSGQPASTDKEYQDPPLLLTQAIPSLFAGWELNSVAVGAQHNVPIPADLDLDMAIHPNLEGLLSHADLPFLQSDEADEFDTYYNQRLAPTSVSSETMSMPAISRLGAVEPPAEELSSSYQHSEESYLDSDIVARRKTERMERNKDDPFYIPETATAASNSAAIHNIFQSSNGPDLDIDSIPIMQLDIEKLASAQSRPQPAAESSPSLPRNRQSQQKPRARVVIATDETLTGSGASTPRYDSENSDRPLRPTSTKLKSSLLQVSSLGIGSLNLDGASSSVGPSTADDEEMAKAMKEVERLRLEMQRASERVHVPHGVDAEGAVIKSKKKTKAAAADVEGKTAAKKKKKKVVKTEDGGENVPPTSTAGVTSEAVGGSSLDVAAPKKKKKKRVVEIAE